jgi:hypothetical protein
MKLLTHGGIESVTFIFLSFASWIVAISLCLLLPQSLAANIGKERIKRKFFITDIY